MKKEPIFIGREKELEKLEDLVHHPKASLVACTGRRRIGKSTLIEVFAKKQKFVFLEFQGLAPQMNLDNSDQLDNFCEQLARQTKIPTVKVNNWTEAFALLNSQIGSKKTVLFFDEISWMASADLDFVGKLKIAWDTQFKQNPQLMVILCGSVSSWIEKNILNNTDFMGRISLTIKLDELPLSTLSLFWRSQSAHVSAFEKFKLIGLTGGVPRYLEEINPKRSAEENIHSLCFQKEGVLFDEFEKIFNDIFDKRAKSYRSIVECLITGSKTFVEICKELKIEKNGVISEYLKDLELSGFIERNYTYHFDGKASKLSKYRIKDNYLRFYLKYVAPLKNKISSGLYDQQSLESMPQWDTIMGLQFESTLLNNLSEIIAHLKIKKNSIISASPYFQTKTKKNKGACQIDLLIHTRNKIIYLCEFKFKSKIDDSIIDEMNKKIKTLSRPSYFSVRPVLIYEGQLLLSDDGKDYFSKIVRAKEFL